MSEIKPQLEASHYLELAALYLHKSGPNSDIDFYSDDADALRVDCRYRARGAHKRGDVLARKVAVERVAVVLATANGDIWPACDNQIHRGLSEERRAVLAAMRRQRYRHQAILVAAELARFYEIDVDTPEILGRIVSKAMTQMQEDKALVTGYKARIGTGEVVAIGGVRE